MRGIEDQQGAMLSYVRLEDRVPDDHPLRRLRALVNGTQASMSKLFDERKQEIGADHQHDDPAHLRP